MPTRTNNYADRYSSETPGGVKIVEPRNNFRFITKNSEVTRATTRKKT